MELADDPQRSRSWIALEEQLLIEHYLAGETLAQIGRLLARDPGSVATHVEILRRRGVDLPARRPRWTEADRQRLAERYRAGVSRRELCAEFGRTEGTIGRQLAWMRTHGYQLTRDA